MNLDLAHLKVAIGGCVFGSEIRSFREIASTQDYAISIAETEPSCHGMVIISESQLFGRGRRGKKWISPPGGLWFSVITKSDIKTSSSIFLSYAMSLAVCETIANDYNLDAYIKWPNDVLIKTRKVAGILISSAIRGEGLEYCVVGAGINLNSRPKGLKGSTSLIEHTSQSSIALEPFLASVLVLFSNYYGEIRSGNWELITKRWKLHCPMMGKGIKAEANGIQMDGVASDIDSNGLLILLTTRGQKVKISDTQDASVKIKS
jgi:BirA family transcriptional regulator, biotin operon repressor / biotin---[acetyl-CoA-carboxylase] ligase